MRISSGAAVLLLLLSVNANAEICRAETTVLCGHRGSGTSLTDEQWPENTTESMLQAYEDGATMVEFDVQHTADGVLVLMHDDTVDRTTDGTGCIEDLNLAALQALDAAAGTPMAGMGIVAPRLLDMIAAVEGDLNLEIKVNNDPNCPAGDPQRLGADVAAALADDPHTRRVMVSSFSLEALLAVQGAAPQTELALISTDLNALQIAADNGFAAVNVAWVLIELARPEADALGLKLGAWTPDGADALEQTLTMGADMVVTNDVSLFAAAVVAACAAEMDVDAGSSDAGVDLGPDHGDTDGDDGCAFGGGSDSTPWAVLLLLFMPVVLSRRRR